MSRNDKEIRERRFAHEIRAALDAGTDDLPADITERLAAARRMAVARKKAEAPVLVPQLAMPGMHAPLFDEDSSPLHRAGAWLRRLG